MRNEHGTSPGSPPYLQKVQRYTRRKDVRNRCRSLPGGSVVTPGIPPGRWSDALSGHSRRRTGHLSRASTYSSVNVGSPKGRES